MSLMEEQEGMFKSQPDAAKSLLGPYAPENAPPEVAAAHMLLARSLMNLDEFVTRE